MMVLTARQLDLLRFIVLYWRHKELAPTIREMGDALGIKKASVLRHVEALEYKGYVKRIPNGRRTIEVIHDPEE